MPEEVADMQIVSKQSMPNWRVRFRNFLEREGSYNFAKMAEAIKSYSDEYCNRVYKKPSSEIYRICAAVWQDEVSGKVDIKDFLIKVKKNPGYTLKGKK